MSVTKRALVALAVLALGVGAMGLVGPAAGAAEVTYDACPDEAGSFLDDGTAYPPFGAPSGDASGLIDCASSYTPSVDTSTNLALLFEFPGLPTDDCYDITALSVTTTGVPLGNGWGIVAYNSVGTEPILTLNGEGGSYQQYSALTGSVLATNGVTLESPSDQPASGSYAVSSPLDTGTISLADLAAGNLGASVIVLDNFGGQIDTIESATATVTLDDTNCQEPTTTTTTVAPAPVAPAPAPVAAPAAAVAAQPRFTG